MASVFKKRNAYIVQTVWSGAKVAASLGRIERRDAVLAEQMLTELERSRSAGSTPSRTAFAWLESVSDRIHSAVVRIGLADPRPAREGLPSTIAKLFADYLEKRHDLSPRAKTNIQQAGKCIGEHLGELRAVARVTPADAERWQKWMKAQGFARATISGHTKKAKQVFAWAVEAGRLPSNPLAALKAGDQVNDARGRFVTREAIGKVMAVAPASWRLLIAFSRFGGIRVPSEAVDLKWSDVKLEQGQIVVRSKKTASIGKGERRIPIFAELLEPLATAYAARVDDSDMMFPMLAKGYNPHTHMIRLVRRAGLEPWPRVWHNLRASRQTELAEAYPMQTVCNWLGNSPAIAAKHYLRVTGEHWAKASAQASAINATSIAQLTQVIMKKDSKTNENSVPDGGNAVNCLPPRGVEPLFTG